MNGLQRRVFMPRIESRSLVWASAALLGLLVFLGQGQEAAATLGYRMLWTTTEMDDGRFLQSQDHRLNLNLAQTLSDRMSSVEGINYHYRWDQEGIGRETVSPRATLAMSGDIFVAGISVNSLRNLNPQTSLSDSDSLGITWSSTWKKKFVPELVANYDYSHSWREVGEPLNDSERQGVGGKMHWDLLLLKVNLIYNQLESKTQSYSTLHDDQLASISTDRTWLDQRLRVALGHEYSQTNDERLFTFGTSTTANFLLNLLDVRTSPDSVPDSDPADDDDNNLSPNPAMSDGDVVALAYGVAPPPVPPPGNNSILIRTDGQQVDHVYLYATDTSGNSLGSSPLGLTWRVYSSNSNTLGPGTTWVQVTAVPIPTYDTFNKRFVIVLPALKVAYLKVVVDLVIPAPDINFTEVQAEQIVHASGRSTKSLASNKVGNRSYFRFDYKFNDAVNFYYSLSVAEEEKDGLMLSERENHSGGLQMQNSAGDLKSNLALSLGKTIESDNLESQTKTYQLDVKKVFLPTLNASVGGSHEESTKAGALLYERNRYTFYGDARLYPDLSSRLDVTYSEQVLYNSSSGDKASDSLRSQFAISSRLIPSLNISFSYVYEEENYTEQLSKQTNTLGLSGNWQVSEWFSMNGAARKSEGTLIHDASDFSVGMLVVLSDCMELGASYAFYKSTSWNQSGEAVFRWTPKRNISWEVGCSYAENEIGTVINAYKLYSKLQVNFAIR